jgi:diphthamide biosynthesis protein 2
VWFFEYLSCCVDVVGAEHYEADSIVHYGHSCLSLVDKLPVYFVFEKLPLNLDLVELELNKILTEQQKKVIILYDVEYTYLYDLMCNKFKEKYQNVFVSILKTSNHQLEINKEKRILFSRLLPQEARNDIESYCFFYIGNKESFLNSFLFYFNKNSFYNFKPLRENTTEQNHQNYEIQPILFSKTNRELMKRFYLIEKAKDARIFGILIGTMSVSNYNEAIDHVGSILKKAKRRYYSFLIGKLNCPKLNNFMEVDMYIMVACNENSLINSKELNKPIITVYELEMAFNSTRVWGEEFVCDFRQLLPGNENFKPFKLSDQESNVSLITGETRFIGSNTDENSNKIYTNSALVNRDDGLSVVHYAAAGKFIYFFMVYNMIAIYFILNSWFIFHILGEYLKNRIWTGLEQNLGQDEIKKAEQGRKGIAASYDSEPKQSW